MSDSKSESDESSSSSNTDSPLETLKDAFAIVSDNPYCTGLVPLDPSMSTVFYRSGEVPAMINFSKATEAQLEALALACQPASFGLEHENVLNESYRKAGKLDSTDFATQLSLSSSGIYGAIVSTFLCGYHAESAFNAELYKLNVYGPGSFFKAHVDTPRDDKMFGSLVVVLPTVHEGGSLKFQHKNQDWTFDSARQVSSDASPQLAFVAFYSDIEHEVLPITSGYRVTLTYNLYLCQGEIPHSVHVEVNPNLAQMKASLAEILADQMFLPKGGFLGFGLRYRYPFSPHSTRLSELTKRLKGPDLVIKEICEALSLEVSLNALYRLEDQQYFYLLDGFVDFGPSQVEENPHFFFREETDGVLAYSTSDEDTRNKDRDPPGWPWVYAACPEPVEWILPLDDFNPFQTSYVTYGNEACLDVAYGEVCLLAKVDPSEARLAA